MARGAWIGIIGVVALVAVGGIGVGVAATAQAGSAPLTAASADKSPALKVSVSTMTPNLAGYRYRIDDQTWIDGSPETWSLHDGTNKLEVTTVNRFGIFGHPSKVVLEVK